MNAFPVPARDGVELTDGHVLLRPFRSDDGGALHDAARESAVEVFPFLPWCHAEYTREEAEAYTRTRDIAWSLGDFSFVITDASSGRYLGGCGLNKLDRELRYANLGYWVRTRATGGGAGTRSVRLLSRWAFDALELVRVEIVTKLDNIASQRVAEKAGALREGVLRNRLTILGRAYDAVMFSLVPGDPDPPALESSRSEERAGRWRDG